MQTVHATRCATPLGDLSRFTVVHSVFAHGFNLASGTSRYLLWIGTSQNPMVMPCSVSVPQPAPAEFVVRGEAARYDAARATLTIAGSLRLDLAGAPVLDTALAAGKLTHPDHVDALRRGLDAHRTRPCSVADAAVTAHVEDRLGALIRALAADDAAEVAAQADRLVGFGRGLTPSGDDALLGAYAFLRVFHPHLAAALAPVITERLGRTTDVSVSYLSLALDGHVAIQLREVLAGFSGTPGDDALAELLGTGHSSGEDIVGGIVTAAQIL